MRFDIKSIMNNSSCFNDLKQDKLIQCTMAGLGSNRFLAAGKKEVDSSGTATSRVPSEVPSVVSAARHPINVGE